MTRPADLRIRVLAIAGSATVRLVRGSGAVRRLAAARLPPDFRSPAAGGVLVRLHGVVDHSVRDVAGHVVAQVSVADARDDGHRVALDRVAEAVASASLTIPVR